MATFGRTDTTGFSDPGADATGNILGNIYTLTEDGTVTSMSAYFTTSSSGTWRGVIYPLSGGSPSSQAAIAATVEGTVTSAGGWFTANFSSGVPLTAGDYALVAWFGGGTHLEYDSSTGTYFYDAGSFYTATGAAPSFANNSSGPGEWGIYATYTPSAPPVVLPFKTPLVGGLAAPLGHSLDGTWTT